MAGQSLRRINTGRPATHQRGGTQAHRSENRVRLVWSVLSVADSEDIDSLLNEEAFPVSGFFFFVRLRYLRSFVVNPVVSGPSAAKKRSMSWTWYVTGAGGRDARNLRP